MARVLQLLIAEDNAADAELLLRALQRAGFEPQAKRVDTEADFAAALHAGLDLILSDYAMPQFTGLRALELLRRSELDIPFIIVSGTIGEEMAVEAMRRGAADYLLKDRLVRLGPAVTRALEDASLRRERQLAAADFRLLFAQNPMPMWVYELDTLRFLAVNNAAVAHYGYSREEFLALTLRDIRPPEEVPRMLASVRDRPQGISHPGIWRHWKKDRTEIMVETTAHRTVFQGRPAELVLAHDVTNRLAAEKALRESEERFRQVVENIREVFWMSDAEKNQMIYVSPRYEQVWGRKREELYASPLAWLEGVQPEDRARVLLAVKTKQVTGDYDETYRIVRPDGVVRWIRDHAFPIPEADGTVRRIVGVAEDITERKLLEEHLLHAQRLEAIGTLTSGVAHDLNNILAPMLMAAGLLKNKLSEPRDREILAMVEQGAKRGASVIGQLLTFGRGAARARSAVQVRLQLRELTHIIRETFPRNIELVEKTPADLWSVLADPTQLHQVLLNLCVNARDAMPAGGRLTLAAANRTLIAAEIGAHAHVGAKPGPYVVITVTDTGTGIAPDIINRIFDPFFTTKGVGAGTGLGLSTALGIVQNHGGFLTVGREAGKGAGFTVYLPALLDPGAVATSASSTPPLGRGELILVVDDEAAIRESVRQLLEKHDYRVLAVGNGQEAIEIFIQQRGAVRLVLTDMMMPKMDGVALIRALRVLEPALKVLVFSGLIQAGDGSDTLRIGEVIAKPFAPDQLLEAIGSVLGRPR